MTKVIHIMRGKKNNVKLLTKQGLYEWAIPTEFKEQAPVVLIEGCTQTRLYMNGTH